MALYTKARHYNITSGIPAFAVHYYRSEDSRNGIDHDRRAEHVPMYENFQYSAANSLLNPYWTQNYEIINAANTVLDQMQKAQEAGEQLDEAELQCGMEARFFRGWCYFNLVRAFGEVPLVDFAITNSDEANIPKSSVDKIYELIDADLTAAEGLPRRWESKYIGRVTYGRRTCVACQDLRPARSVVADVSGCQECDRYQGLQSRHAVRRDFPRRGRKLFGIGLGVAVHGHRRAARDQRSGQPVLPGAGLPRFGYEQSGLGLAYGRPVDRRRGSKRAIRAATRRCSTSRPLRSRGLRSLRRPATPPSMKNSYRRTVWTATTTTRKPIAVPNCANITAATTDSGTIFV